MNLVPTNKDKAIVGASGVNMAAVLAVAYEIFFGMQGDIASIQAEISVLSTAHAQRCEVDSKYFEGQASLMTELAGIEKNTASRYVALAEANGGLSEVDRLRMEEKLRRQAEYEGRGQAFSQAAQTVCLQP
jgi:hypothetical protein